MSLYEARVYLALLRGGAQNGHELSKSAGVPSSKVYSVLDKLGEAGIVQQVRSDRPSAAYVPLPPDQLTARLRDRFVGSIEALEEELPRLSAGQATSEVVTLSGWGPVVAEARRVVEGARSEVYVSLWPQALDELRGALDEAHARRVAIFGMLYGEGEPGPGTWEHHTHLDIVHRRVSGQMLTIVADGGDAVVAHAPDGGEPLAVRTQNPVICLVADEYMRHELVLQQAQRATGDQRWDDWWTADPRVRSVMLGRALGQADGVS